MIELEMRVLNSVEFNKALNKLASEPLSSMHSTYNLSRIIRQVGKELGIARELYQSWSKDFFEKDENGKLILAENSHPYVPYKVKEGKEEEFNERLGEFLAMKVQLESYPLKVSDLGSAKVSANDLLALEPIFDSSVAASQPEL